MRRTTAGDLARPFLVVGAAVYLVVRYAYDVLPPVQYLWSVPLGFLAVVEVVISRRVRAVVRHEPHARPLTALAIARAVALGKASALVSAGVLGAAVGLIADLAARAGTLRAAASDLRAAIVLLVVSGLLLGAGLLLESSGIDPNRSGRSDVTAA